MPLFESQKSRNKRLFDTVSDRLYYSFSTLITDDYDKQVYLGLLLGGTVAAKQVVESGVEYGGCIKEVWGKGSEEKALALIKLFTLCMLSTWYRWLDEQEQHPEDEQRLAREMAASGILALFGDNTENAVRDFLNMDIQYNYDWANKTKRMPMFKWSSLVLAKACEACGQPAINWSRIAFPVKEWQEVVDAEAIIDHRPFIDYRGTVALRICEVTGVETISKYFKEHTNILKEERR